MRTPKAVFYAFSFFPELSSRTGWLDGFAVPAPAQVAREKHTGRGPQVRWLAGHFSGEKLNPNSSWLAGQNADLRGVGIKVFWAFPTIVVKDEPDLIVLFMPAGVLGRNVTHKPSPKEMFSPSEIKVVEYTWKRTDVLMLIVPGESFSTYIMWKTGTKDLDCWYINLQEPIRRTPIGFDTMDHTLDIVINPDMSEWKWKDNEEFIKVQKAGVYSAEKANNIRAEGEKAVRLVTSERRSLYEEWKTWQANPQWEIPKLSPHWDRVNFDGVDLHNMV